MCVYIISYFHFINYLWYTSCSVFGGLTTMISTRYSYSPLNLEGVVFIMFVDNDAYAHFVQLVLLLDLTLTFYIA